MKKQTYTLVATMMFIAVIGVSSAKAQTGPTIMRVDIPFTFSVGEQTLPAGEYRVTCVKAASDLKMLQLREKAGGATVLVRTSSLTGNTHDNAQLIFNRYGEQYFFAQAWLPGNNVGMQARKSTREKVTIRELARVKRGPEVVAVAANR